MRWSTWYAASSIHYFLGHSNDIIEEEKICVNRRWKDKIMQNCDSHTQNIKFLKKNNNINID